MKLKNVSTSRTARKKKHLTMKEGQLWRLPAASRPRSGASTDRASSVCPNPRLLFSSVWNFLEDFKSQFKFRGEIYIYIYLGGGKDHLRYYIYIWGGGKDHSRHQFPKSNSRLSRSTHKHQKAQRKEPVHQHARSGTPQKSRGAVILWRTLTLSVGDSVSRRTQITPIAREARTHHY